MILRAKKFAYIISVALLVIGTQQITYAQSSSTSYKVNESAFSSGSGIDSNSASYNARGSAGDLGVGESTSASYAAFAGPINPSEEYLEMVVNLATINLGTLTTSTTATGTATFYVRTYLNGGYSVQTVSNPPTNEAGFSLTGMAAGASTVGTEQFGINLVANTSPVSFGAVPVKQPSSVYANGIAAAGYNTANIFKYTKNDIIAQSGAGRAWGETDYTISYITNVSYTTRAGVYSMAHELVAITTF